MLHDSMLIRLTPKETRGSILSVGGNGSPPWEIFEMVEYNVVLKDADGYDIGSDLVGGMAAAKARAKYFLTDSYAQNIGTTQTALGTQKVEVQDVRTSECLWDAFRKEG